MKRLHDRVHFVELCLACLFGHGRTPDRADEQIFGCMAEIHKFQQLCFISHACQKVAADGVSSQCRHALLHDAVAGEEGERIGVHLSIQLVLAAGNGKDHVRIPADRVVQRLVRGGVTGVERHYYIHVEGCLVAVDIAQLKTKTVIAVFLGGKIALVNDIRL